MARPHKHEVPQKPNACSQKGSKTLLSCRVCPTTVYKRLQDLKNKFFLLCRRRQPMRWQSPSLFFLTFCNEFWFVVGWIQEHESFWVGHLKYPVGYLKHPTQPKLLSRKKKKRKKKTKKKKQVRHFSFSPSDVSFKPWLGGLKNMKDFGSDI